MDSYALAMDNKDVQEMNLAELKQLAGYYQLDTTGKESDLILRLQSFLCSEEFDDAFRGMSVVNTPVLSPKTPHRKLSFRELSRFVPKNIFRELSCVKFVPKKRRTYSDGAYSSEEEKGVLIPRRRESFSNARGFFIRVSLELECPS